MSKICVSLSYVVGLNFEMFHIKCQYSNLNIGLSFIVLCSYNNKYLPDIVIIILQKQGQESEWKEKFEDALQKVNDYMNKKDDGELTPISDEQYLCKSNSSSPDPSHSEKNDVESTTNESSWYPVQNVNIVEESQTVDMVTR